MAEVAANLGPQRVLTGLKPLVLLVGVAAAIAAGVAVTFAIPRDANVT